MDLYESAEDAAAAAAASIMAGPRPTPHQQAQIALRRLCLDERGKLTPDAKRVWVMLRNACGGNAKLGAMVPRTRNGAIDPLAMAQMLGRREILDMLERMLLLDLQNRHNLEKEVEW